MITFPVPSWSTTLAIAHLRRPVPIIFWAANPPGSLDLTYFFSSIISSSSGGAATVAVIDREERRSDFAGNANTEFARGKEMVLGLWETWEENESEEREAARFEIDAIVAERRKWSWAQEFRPTGKRKKITSRVKKMRLDTVPIASWAFQVGPLEPIKNLNWA